MAKIFKFLLLAMIAAGTSAAVTVLYHSVLKPGSTPSLDLTYVDFLSITLTALALILTVLGFFVAAASVIGWATLEAKLRDHSINYFKDQLSKNGELRTELEKLISDIAYDGVEEYQEKEKMSDPVTDEDKESQYHD